MKGSLLYCLAFSASVLLTSCGDGRLDPDRSGSEFVLIKAPSSCGYGFQGMDALTKAGAGSDGFDNLFIPTQNSIGNIRDMRKGSTLWLLIETPEPGYVYKPYYSSPDDVEEPAGWQESEFSYKPYVVGDNGAMYPCETLDYTETRDGKEAIYRSVKRDALTGEILSSGSALMLPPGLYKFHAVSPASDLLISLDGEPQPPMVHMMNGEYMLATDVRWKETYPKGVLIQGGTDVSGVHSVSLAALVNQTARIKVNIICGEHVRKLALQKGGVEISGIQEDEHADFKWTMDGEPIQTRIGNKYEGTMLRDIEHTKDAEGHDMITGYASILPTDARTNTIYMLFHLVVNNVPTQYMVGLTNQLYEAAHEYVFNFKVRMDGNITVGTWDNNSLIYDDVELN